MFIYLNAWLLPTLHRLGGVALLEEACHWGVNFGVSHAQARLSISFCFLLIRMRNSQLILQHPIFLHAAISS